MVFSIFLAWYFFLFDIINSYVYYKLRANWIFFKNNRTSFPLVKLYFFDIKLLIRAKIFTTVRYFCIFVLREYNSWRGGREIFKIFKIYNLFYPTIVFFLLSFFRLLWKFSISLSIYLVEETNHHLSFHRSLVQTILLN